MTDYVISEGQTSVGLPEESAKGTGYINTNYYGNVERQEGVQQQESTSDAELISNLSQKLGVSLDEQTNEVTQTDTQQTQEDFSKKFTTEEGQRLVADFKKVTGIDLQEAFGIVQQTAQLTHELENWRRQVQVDRQAQELRQEWGSDFDVLMPKVAEEFKSLSPEMQRALDNPDGARLLAAKIRQRERSGLKGGSSPQYVPSGNVRNLSGGGNKAPVIRMSEMVTWSGVEMDKRMPDIIRAKQAGTLINDM